MELLAAALDWLTLQIVYVVVVMKVAVAVVVSFVIITLSSLH